jgi:holliday junction DNA helicase RuvB
MAGFRELLVQQSLTFSGQLAGQAIRSRRPAEPPRTATVEIERPALRDAEALLQQHRALVDAEKAGVQKPGGNISPTIFGDIEGHDDVKRLLLAALQAKKPVHVLLVGPPATGKSQFLQAIAALPRARYAVGGATTSSGLISYLLEKPETRILVIDELDKADPADLYALYSLMESGKVTRLQHESHEDVKREVWVFAAANSTHLLPEALASRFVRLDLPAYDQAQVEQITQSVLVRREGVTRPRARAIARATAARSRDPRDGVQVARLSREGEPIEPLVAQVTRHPPVSKARPKRLS